MHAAGSDPGVRQRQRGKNPPLVRRLARLGHACAYAPLDICEEMLLRAAREQIARRIAFYSSLSASEGLSMNGLRRPWRRSMTLLRLFSSALGGSMRCQARNSARSSSSGRP